MATIIIELVATAIIIGILDFIWLGVVAKKLYWDEIGSLLLKKPRALPAALFYSMFTVGICAFVVYPSVINGAGLSALIWGAAFGLVCYGTYDLTNAATLKGFSTKIVVLDMVWGTALGAIAAVGAYMVTSLLT